MKQKYRDILFLRYCIHCKNCKSTGSAGSALPVSKHGAALDNIHSVSEMRSVIRFLTEDCERNSRAVVSYEWCTVYEYTKSRKVGEKI